MATGKAIHRFKMGKTMKPILVLLVNEMDIINTCFGNYVTCQIPLQNMSLYWKGSWLKACPYPWPMAHLFQATFNTKQRHFHRLWNSLIKFGLYGHIPPAKAFTFSAHFSVH